MSDGIQFKEELCNKLRRKMMSKKLTIEEVQDKIWAIERQYPKQATANIDLLRINNSSIYTIHPYDRNNLLRYYKLLDKRKKEENK